jgi:hypothetical protein
LSYFQTLPEIMRLRTVNVVRDYSIDFSHVGTLFVLDAEKSGRFSEDNFINFVNLCYSRENGESNSRGDFQVRSSTTSVSPFNYLFGLKP